jgi:hypothetical protein
MQKLEIYIQHKSAKILIRCFKCKRPIKIIIDLHLSEVEINEYNYRR